MKRINGVLKSLADEALEASRLVVVYCLIFAAYLALKIPAIRRRVEEEERMALQRDAD